MFKKLTLAAAAGAGYVLGAKAGKERYQQIETKFREIAGMPAVQNATSTVKETAAPLLDSAKETVGDKVSSVTDKASGGGNSEVVDLGASGTGAATRPPVATTTTSRSTTAAGAAPSATAPIKRP